jgi:uncharacterized protein (TIRG00374 family)
MVEEKKALTPKTGLFLAVGLLVFILYIYFFVDIPEMLAILQSINLFYYALAASATVMSVALYSLAWQFLLRRLSIKSAFRKTFLFVWSGNFVDLLLPAEAVSSDILKIYLMTKSTGEDAGKVGASVMSKRILSMSVALGGLIVGSAFLIVEYPIPQWVLLFVLIVIAYSVISTAVLCFLCIREKATWKIIDRIINFFEWLSRGRWHLSKLKPRAQKALKAFRQGIAVLGRDPKGLVLPVVALAVTWLFDVLTMLLVFLAIGVTIPFSGLVVVFSLMITVQAFPLGIPAEIGPTEIMMTWLFSSLGLPGGVDAAATILTRMLFVWLKILIGYFAAQYVGVKALGIAPSTS